MAEVGICVDVNEETFQDHFAARFLFEFQVKVLIRGNCWAWVQRFNASLNSEGVFVTTAQDGNLSYFFVYSLVFVGGVSSVFGLSSFKVPERDIGVRKCRNNDLQRYTEISVALKSARLSSGV